jgi:hypothetical protein
MALMLSSNATRRHLPLPHLPFKKHKGPGWDLAHEFKLPASRSFPAHGLMVALAQQQKAAAMTGICKKNQQNCRGKSQRIGNSAQRLA